MSFNLLNPTSVLHMKMGMNLTRRTLPLVSSAGLSFRSLSIAQRANESQIESPQNLVEKIVQRYAVDLSPGQRVKAGDFVFIQPKHVMTHDNTGAVMSKFSSIQAKKFFNVRQPVFTLDHDVQNKTEKNVAKYKNIEEFAKSHGIDFYPAGRGIGHQVMVEEGYAFPMNLTVASDSHSNMYGGVGSLGTPVVRTDAAALWVTGKTWWQVPQVAKVNLVGKIPAGVTGKDIIIALCGHFNKDEVLNYCVEFSGEGVAQLSIDDRLAIANMTTEWGALAGVFPVDKVTLDWYKQRAKFLEKRGLPKVPSDALASKVKNPRINQETIEALEKDDCRPDPGAFYHKELTLDLSTVVPHVSGPNHVKVMKSIYEMQQKKVKINKAYLVSCVNSRLDDIRQAAAVVKGKKVALHVQFYIAAASNEVQAAAEASGDWKTLLDAGAIPLPSGCGPCVGLGTGLLEDGEIGISATNRNFKGRMGSPKAEAYLASPAVVAASAIAGEITAPQVLSSPPTVRGGVKVNRPQASNKKVVVELAPGFPSMMKGRVIFCHQDNLNTDGIYPGKYTYVDSMTPEEMAKVVMENYDTSFTSIVKRGDILVGGFNFGTGSSREQAATALKACGIQVLLAGSYSETFKRNSINNAFLPIEVPELVEDLKRQFGKGAATVNTNLEAEIDFVASQLTFNGKVYLFGAVGKAAQELIMEGGLESWIKARV